MELKSISCNETGTRYYIDGRKVSREKFNDVKAAANGLDSFLTKLTKTKQGDKITQYCRAY